MNGESPVTGAPARCTPIVNPSADPDKRPTVTIARTLAARWLEYVEAAIDAESERQRVDILVDLAESIENVWLTPETAA